MIKILSVAGYDGSGGAGITSDSKIFSSLGIYGLSATSALTAQNPQSIHEVLPIPDKFFEKELKAVFEYFNIDAVKTGIISGTRQAEILARLIKKYKAGNILNMQKEESCVKSGYSKRLIDSNIARGKDIGVKGTPMLFIYKGLMLYKTQKGYSPYPVIKSLIDGALSGS